jgi:cytoskeletal protein RodZ
MKKLTNSGFGLIGILLVVVVVVIIGVGGWAVYKHNHKTANTTTSNSSSSKSSQTSTKPIDPYAGWKTYTDTGYSEASGITVKYPADWQVKVGGSNAFAWEIIQNASPNASVNVRDVYLTAATTPQQEWDNCPSADSCGPAPGSTKLEGNTTTVNGLASYNVKMQSSTGTIYYATVIKGNKTTSAGTVFVEFIVNSPDAATLTTYNQVIASANFSN